MGSALCLATTLTRRLRGGPRFGSSGLRILPARVEGGRLAGHRRNLGLRPQQRVLLHVLIRLQMRLFAGNGLAPRLRLRLRLAPAGSGHLEASQLPTGLLEGRLQCLPLLLVAALGHLRIL